MTGAYALAAVKVREKGWRAIPVDIPGMLPRGVTGYEGKDPNRAMREGWLEKYPDANIGIVMPTNVVGLDVDLDVEHNKDGVPVFTEITGGADAFPSTYSNGHGDPSSLYRHWFYRVPDDVSVDEVASLGGGLRGVDIIKWNHRWSRCAPSIHAKTKEQYRWLKPDGSRCPTPTPEDLPQLTRAQWDHLVEIVGSTRRTRYGSIDVDTEAWLEAHAGEPSKAAADVVRAHWTSVDATDHGGHHDGALRALMALAHLGEEGECVTEQIEALRQEFLDYRDDDGEFERMLVPAIEQAVAKTLSGDRDTVAVLEGDEIERFLARRAVERVVGKEARLAATELAEEFNDVNVASLFKREHANVVWAEGLGWLQWNGKRWKPVGNAIVGDLLRVWLIEWFNREVAEGANQERRAKINALLTMSRQERLFRQLKVTDPIEANRLDQHLDLLNCPNGVVDLRTGEILPHDPGLWLTKITRAPYVPGAHSADWKTIKDDIEPVRSDYLLQRLGQSVTGYPPPDDKVVFLTGVGGNGKSTFMDPVRICLGSYAGQVPQSLLLGASDRHPAEMMTLAGVRLATLEETPEEGHLNTQRLKAISGTETVTARKMRQDFVEFTAQHSLFVNTNYPPNVVETDHGTWRRLERVVFSRRFRDGDQGIDTTLRQRARQDMEVWTAVLADLVEYAKDYYRNDRTLALPPAAVLADTAEWRGRSDVLLEVLPGLLEADPNSFVASDDILESVNEHLRSQGMKEWSAKLLSSRLATHEALPFNLVKDKKRLNMKGYSPRNGFSTTQNGNPVWVWFGAKWSE